MCRWLSEPTATASSDVHFTTAEGFIAAPENRSEGTIALKGFLKLTMVQRKNL